MRAGAHCFRRSSNRKVKRKWPRGERKYHPSLKGSPAGISKYLQHITYMSYLTAALISSPGKRRLPPIPTVNQQLNFFEAMKFCSSALKSWSCCTFQMSQILKPVPWQANTLHGISRTLTLACYPFPRRKGAKEKIWKEGFPLAFCHRHWMQTCKFGGLTKVIDSQVHLKAISSLGVRA